jgi:hypothetical protein
VACSNFTFGYFRATLSVGSMKPNEVVKMRPWPVRASCSMARSESASGTLSTKVVSTRLPNSFSMALRPTSCW